MTDVLDGVRDHYRATGLTERLKTALTALGPEDQRLTPAATGRPRPVSHPRARCDRRACQVGWDHRRHVGSGRRLGRRRAGALSGCDLWLPGDGRRPQRAIRGGRALSDRAHGTERAGVVRDRQRAGASVRRRPFRRRVAAACGDEHRRPGAALPRDPARAEVRRQVCDLRRRVEQRRAALSRSLGANAGDELSPDSRATREAIEPAGFRTLAWQDDTEAAKAWIAQLRASGPPPSPNLGVVMGPDFAAACRQPGTKSHGRPARHPDRGVRGCVREDADSHGEPLMTAAAVPTRYRFAAPRLAQPALDRPDHGPVDRVDLLAADHPGQRRSDHGSPVDGPWGYRGRFVARPRKH